MNLKEYYKENYPKFEFEKFNIADELSDSNKIVFIIESPYTAEIENKKPLQGSSGKKFYDTINLLQSKLNTQLSVGIMESSPIPLDRKVYSMLGHEIISDELFNIKDREKEFQEAGNYDEFKEFIKLTIHDHAILTDYSDRLANLMSKETNIVICGFIAQAFFEKSQNLSGKASYRNFYKKWDIYSKNNILYLNHPRNWDVKQHSIVEILKEKIGS